MVVCFLGKVLDKVCLVVFVIGLVIIGFVGVFYGMFYVFVSLQDVLLILMFQIWVMFIVGGVGNNKGVMVGVFLIWGVWIFFGWVLLWFVFIEV